MFGRDPWLPIDRLIELDKTQSHEPCTWISRHQKELRSAHSRAADKLAKEAEIRKQKYDKQSRVKPSTIDIGQRVLVRDRTVRGRNKIQDQWSAKVHKVIDQLENGAYVVEPTDGRGSTRVVNHAELQVCPPSALQKTPAGARRQRVPAAPRHPSSSDDDSHPGLAIEFAPPPVDAEPDDTADVSSSDSDEIVGDEHDKLAVRPVRRSTRSTAGHHSNRYRLPMSTLKH